jgi:predicted heme/steroid binding protein
MKVKSILLTFIAALIMVSCYKFTLIEQPHEAVTNSVFNGKVVVKRSGTSDNGNVLHVYGLFGICVPDGWKAEGDIVMTQVPKPGTDVGDDEYKSVITRRLVPNDKYTALLNKDYPKSGYKWIGFMTDRDFKSLFNASTPETEVDSIYAEFSIRTDDKTGTFHLDYIAGHATFDKADDIGGEERGNQTRIATFAGDNISNVTFTDTHITVTRPDGSTDNPTDGPDIKPEWDLERMPDATRDGAAVAYKDLKYNRLFTRTRGWNGGDGVLTVGLPDGSVFWTFNDSFYGRVNADDRSRGDCNFPRNSVMLQKATDGVLGETEDDLIWLADYVNWTDPAAARYFHCRTHLRHPDGEKTLDEILAGDIDQDRVYWSGDGTIYDGKLQMMWMGTASQELRALGTSLATYRLDGTIPEGYYLDDIPDYLPKKGNYLYRELVKHQINDNTVSYGSTLCEGDDGHNYLYATNGYDVLVARTETHDLYSKWQYYVRPEEGGDFVWQDAYPTDEEMKRSQIMENNHQCSMPWVFKDGDWYYMTAQGPYFAREVYIYRSKTPYGPFGEKRLLFVLPGELDKLGDTAYHWLYMVNLHPALSREGELVFSTNSDPDNFWKNFNDPGSADYYRPFFYRVFNWKNLFGDDTTSGIGGVSVTPVVKDGHYYNLQGIRVDRPTRGIYIHNGRKVVVR